jgi:hypothetical protein
MIQFHPIFERLETILREKNGQKKVLNKTIARELGLTPEYFAVIKKRGKIPYMALALFAQREGINLNWLLLGTHPKRLSSDHSSSS